jgi:sulfoxide reductase heme-binding subunit YedZ
LSYDVALWELIRASGLLAYVLLSAGVALGIAVRVRALDWIMKRAWAFESHQVLSVLAMAFTIIHVALLLGNSHVPFGVKEILIPFAVAWRPAAAAMGTLALYLVGLLVVSSYIRPLIGQKLWRAIHYGGFVAWVMALAHGITAGSDSGLPWVQYVYLGTGLLVAFLSVFRFLDGSPSPARADGPRKVAAEAAGMSGSSVPAHQSRTDRAHQGESDAERTLAQL